MSEGHKQMLNLVIEIFVTLKKSKLRKIRLHQSLVELWS